MKDELNDKSPEYKFLLATFRADPNYFIEQLLRSHWNFDRTRLTNIIQAIVRDKIGQRELSHFNNEVVSAFEKTANSKWESISNEKNSSPFEFLKRYAEDMLIMQADIPYFRISKTDIWSKLTHDLGEDLFTATFLADRCIKHGDEPKHFQWNYILHSNFFSLNNLLSRKQLVENHYHLKGSAPNVDLSWLYLMNNPIGQKEKFKGFEKGFALEQQSIYTNDSFHQSGLHILTLIAAYIRVVLFEECCIGGNGKPFKLGAIISTIRSIHDNQTVIYSDEMLGKINPHKYLSAYRTGKGEVVDYAIIDFGRKADSIYIEIAGERHLYYSCLKRIFRYDNKSFDIQVLFYLYLLIKAEFNGLFIQRNDKYGFDNFQRYQSQKSSIIKGTLYDTIAVRMATKYNIKENHIQQQESRIPPEADVNSLKRNIDWIDSVGKAVKDKYFYVLHFLKTEENDWGTDSKYKDLPVCRESKLRERIKNEANAIEKLRRDARDASFRIYGIDAASHEVDCRPENFGQVFRYLSERKQSYPYLHYDENKNHLPDLRKTFHVGEDFYDIIDGLRAIDEAILFLKLRHGDRIGHAVALGLDPDKYYSNRRIISMPLQNALDNVAWLLYSAEKFNITISTSFYAHLNYSFVKHYNDLHQKTSFNRDIISPSDLFSYINSWKLRGDNPECYKNAYDEDEIKHFNPLTTWERYNFVDRKKYKEVAENVYNLYRRYHFDFDLKKAAEKVIEIEISDQYVELVKQIQIIMRNFVLKEGVAIESNPSSNHIISSLDKTIDLPIFKMFPIKESESDFLRLNVSVNTDDQGVFYTSLVKEYTLLVDALQRELHSNGLRKYSDDNILNWVNHLIDNGKEQCFVQENKS